MKYNVLKKGEIAIFSPEGELDVSNVPELNKALGEILKGGQKKIIIDLDRVSYMDSSALGVLVNSLKELRKQNGILKIANLKGNVERIFKLTRLIKFFETYSSTEQAMLSLN